MSIYKSLRSFEHELDGDNQEVTHTLAKKESNVARRSSIFAVIVGGSGFSGVW
ncbi:hypothetical protein ACNKHP_19560 [Shigella boydii]